MASVGLVVRRWGGLFVTLACALTACSRAAERDAPTGKTTSAVTTADGVTCVTLQRGTGAAVGDAYVKANAQAQSYGAQPILRVSAKEEALLRFDLSSIPPSAA